MFGPLTRGRAGKIAGAVFGLLPLTACQPGMSTTPPVVPVPPVVLGLPIFLIPEPTIAKVEDEAGRPLAMALEHGVRDALEEAGFKLAPSKDAASGLVAHLFIERVGVIHADLFIHGAEACGVRLDLTRGSTRLATAEPEVACASTSAYYGILAKDAAVALVNTASRSPALATAAAALRPPAAPPVTAPAP